MRAAIRNCHGNSFERFPALLPAAMAMAKTTQKRSGMARKAMAVTDIYAESWYDYHAKYSVGGSTHVIPADIPADIYDACMDYAVRAHVALGCRGLSRTDFRWDEEKGLSGLILLETNTQPGMTPTSLAPEQAAHIGIDFPALCRRLVEDATCDR